ncbi:MAG TPA: ATP-binding protein [Micromonosporaceae bacterium]|nr:ATP-binding protein [Micromonosporaceae bacterium]
MTEDQLKALEALRLDWAPVEDDVWRLPPYHVEGLHRDTERMVLKGIDDALRSSASSPIGLAVQGQRGTGKTHMLGWVREQVNAQGGYFFLVSLLDAEGFWASVMQSLDDGLARSADGKETQLRTILRDLGDRARAPRAMRRAVAGDTTLSREVLDTFIDRLTERVPQVQGCEDTARALVLLASDASSVRQVGETYMQSLSEGQDERAAWGLRQKPRPQQLIVRDVSRLLALSGPVVIAVDQIDTLIAQSVKSTLDGQGPEGPGQDAVLERVAGGLMSLRQQTRRTLTVVACIPATWQLIKTQATDTVQDRFREATQLKTIPSADIARALVEKRFAWHFTEAGFVPEYPSWPVRPETFGGAVGFTPRQLLIKIDAHIQDCLARETVSELAFLGDPPTVEPRPPVKPPPPATAPKLAELDARYAELLEATDPAEVLSENAEDTVMPSLLTAGLQAWIMERGDAADVFSVDPPPGPRPALHARLRRTLDEGTEDQVHWGFRAISASNAVAALSRLRKASVAAGLTDAVPKRKLFVLRNIDWSQGAATQQELARFHAAGGKDIGFDNRDVRALQALSTLLKEESSSLQSWLLARRPASEIEVFRQALGDQDGNTAMIDGLPESPSDQGGGAAPSSEMSGSSTRPVKSKLQSVSSPTHVVRADRGRDHLNLGVGFDNDAPVSIELEALRKHIAIFAGSGSGKTVLIRRIVEECALRGVSAIVLDPNNDLARLGDPWPEPPATWGPGDFSRANDYLDNTDVVVWTPRREGGRPLTFRPLPEFRAVRDDPDEFAEAVESAVASIVPRAKLDGRTNKALLGQAVLRNAVQYYGRRGGNSMRGLIDLLAAMPDDVSELDSAAKIGGDLAQVLTAAMVNDPLFGGRGTAADPGTLLTPPEGKRARVSVVSFVGLPSDDQRQSFVNQLQMALFAWIKKNPAGDRPLGGLLVMDEAQTLAPSGAMTPCTQSTLALAAQARKYGLGLLFATQAPKGLHNRIPGNAATQFFGLLNAPVQIAAAREMAQAKGGDVPDVSLLKSGQFYVAVEGSTFAKIRTPLCLTHHPKAPLTTEEVIARARRGI